MSFDLQLVLDSLPLLGLGALVTIEITAVAVSMGVMIGLFVGIAELSRYGWLRVPAKLYVDFIRGTPLLVQIFIIYFALPVIIGARIDPFILSIPVLTSPRSSAQVFSPSIAVRPKLDVPWE